MSILDRLSYLMQINYCPCLMVRLPDENVIHLVKNYEMNNIGITFCNIRGIVASRNNTLTVCPECISIMTKHNIRIL